MELKIQSPLKNMPDCWQNEERMNVLMAPFRKRDVNPLDWDSKMKFWKNCINMWTSDSKQFRFSIVELQKSFDRKGRTPKCLSTVVENMMKNGELMLESEFLKMMPTHNESWASWTVKLVVKTPATWAFEKMKRSLFDTLANDPDVQFVHLNVLKEMGEQFVETVQKDNSLEILTIEKVREILQMSSPETVNLIIHWLQLKGLVNVLKHNNTTLVKLITNQSKSKKICEVDVAIFTLKENEKELMKALEQLELEKHEAEQEARSYIRKGMRQVVSILVCILL
uniref:Charged multivesicular body protein 7 n=1 Tax=Clastoptera arizonana TaxID=38151 RepID=A0A1B6DIR5_9HEMI